MNKLIQLIDRLEEQKSLTVDEYQILIEQQSEDLARYAAKKADRIRQAIYGKDVYIRGLIEVGNLCRNDCYYCGIRRSNHNCDRYMLSKEQILECCTQGYELGFRTFVMQGGEGVFAVDFICDVLREIKASYPDCAVTLSLGEYTREEYQQMYDAGGNRYLLRHETANQDHYEKLHPASLSYDNRMSCLKDLKEIGFQVGCGFMVGSPYQTTGHIANDMKFIEEFSPDMVGIGPFIPQKDTPFASFAPGTAEQTTYLLSLIRILKPNILLPATTALGTILSGGREKGIMAGANVVMPNLSPLSERKKYALYDNKIAMDEESAQSVAKLKAKMESIGYQVVTARGDIKK